MCLYAISKKFNPPTTKIIWAWKGFWDYGGGRLSFPVFDSLPAKRGKWLTAEQKKAMTDRNGVLYTTGFHVYRDKPTGKHKFFGDVLKRVMVRGITYQGPQQGKVCFVAQEMFIPAQKKRKPA